MGAHRTAEEKAKPRPRVRHVWLYPSRSALTRVQGLVVEFGLMRGGDERWRVVYVSPETPPTVVDSYVPARVCVPIESRPTEPNY